MNQKPLPRGGQQQIDQAVLLRQRAAGLLRLLDAAAQHLRLLVLLQPQAHVLAQGPLHPTRAQPGRADDREDDAGDGRLVGRARREQLREQRQQHRHDEGQRRRRIEGGGDQRAGTDGGQREDDEVAVGLRQPGQQPQPDRRPGQPVQREAQPVALQPGRRPARVRCAALVGEADQRAGTDQACQAAKPGDEVGRLGLVPQQHTSSGPTSAAEVIEPETAPRCRRSCSRCCACSIVSVVAIDAPLVRDRKRAGFIVPERTHASQQQIGRIGPDLSRINRTARVQRGMRHLAPACQDRAPRHDGVGMRRCFRRGMPPLVHPPSSLGAFRMTKLVLCAVATAAAALTLNVSAQSPASMRPPRRWTRTWC